MQAYIVLPAILLDPVKRSVLRSVIVERHRVMEIDSSLEVFLKYQATLHLCIILSIIILPHQFECRRIVTYQ